MLNAADAGFLYPYQTLVANGDGVKVKTFEEIMQEKRLRKQELEEQAKGFAETDPLRKQTAERTLKRKVPSASPAKVPVKKLISLKSKAAASPRDDSQSPDSSKENPDAQSKRSVEVKQAKAAKEPEQEHPADTKGTGTALTEGCVSCKCACVLNGLWLFI